MNVRTRMATVGPRLALAIALLITVTPSVGAQVKITAAAEEVTVDIDGKPFTVFHTGGPTLNRVYLHPLRAATGTVVNRSFPAGQIPGETLDHPHHAGLFYGHGDVNGFNFWAIQNVARGATPAEPAADPSRPLPVAAGPAPTDATLGRIVAKGPVRAHSGKATGTIDVVLSWLKPDGKPLLTETRRMTFHSHPTLRIIDIDLDLQAIERAEFRDTKEGTFALRMATALEEPAKEAKPGAITRTGRLRNAEGAVGEANVWGKRSAWVDYAGRLGDEPVGIVMMDHPSNPRHPTYWHSRGYGLHAINPFGWHDFLNDKTVNGALVLEPGQHVRFRYRVVIHPGLSPEEIATLFKAYSQAPLASSAP
ncbi:hypothetical protein LuPra_00607 [Luteitalea pratensis]|uniref:Methane oxygenase PmoA n=1 Tax=Luteitalea pratensis TaxID=1855912 RepID=A0A143PI41_LUTPR|nr:PmoA family protein [Luteitalea pratensis]AMY07434.1 hypothetical protein LuPra_00607 [Luteitalea pratensis]